MPKNKQKIKNYQNACCNRPLKFFSPKLRLPVKIKQDRYEDKKTPGHQSKILIGVDGAEGGSELDSPAHTNGHSSHHATPNHSMNGHFSKVTFCDQNNQNNRQISKIYSFKYFDNLKAEVPFLKCELCGCFVN